MENYEQYIGRKCKKKAIGGDANYKVKPFKSTFKTNTIKGVINHPHLNKPAYVFFEDDSYVDCRRISILD